MHRKRLTERTLLLSLLFAAFLLGHSPLASATGRGDGIASEAPGSAMLEQEQRAPRRVGKLDVRTYDRLQRLRAGDKVRVGIWLTSPPLDPELIERPQAMLTAIEMEGITKRRTQVLAAAYRAHSKRLVSLIESKRGKVNLVSRLAPLAYAEVRARDLQDLQARAEVDTIYLEGLTGAPDLDTMVKVHKADVLWGPSANVVGSQARACVIEPDGVAANNPYLRVEGYYATPNPGKHATFVAGIIQSIWNPDRFFRRDLRGHAWGALPILSGNSGDYTETNLVGATEWCVAQGASVVNHSYTVDKTRNPVGLDRYLDHVVRYHRVLQVKSAGNEGPNPATVTSPGKGYNVLTVGSIDDRDTFTSWMDDRISGYSSYIDPYAPGTGGVIGKPEVVAVGCHSSSRPIRSTTDRSPWTGTSGCGTSYAAPAVVGTALLMQQRNPELKVWPEATKAIIMATAIQNIEGSRVFSDKDGAGRIRSDLAVDWAGKVMGDSPQVKYTEFNPSTYGTQDELTFSRPLNGRLRCTLVWDADSAGIDHQTNLDLRVVRASTGTVIASSTSLSNAFEIVDVDVPATDTYKVRVSVTRANNETSNYMGLACYVP